MEDKKKLPERKKTFQILDHSYSVDFPNTGELIDIEALKVSLSKNKYSGINDSETFLGAYVKQTIDMIATFTILFKDLKKNMNVDSISQLKVDESRVLLKIYLKEVLPWLNEWFQFLNADDEVEEEK